MCDFEKEEDIAISTPVLIKTARKKQSTKRSRRESYDRHLRKLYAHAYFRALKKLNYDDPSSKVVRSKSRNGCERYYKRHSNRKVRHYTSEIPKGSGYKRIFDYWWTID